MTKLHHAIGLATLAAIGSAVGLSAQAEAIFRFATEDASGKANLDPLDPTYSYWLTQPIFNRLLRLDADGKPEGELSTEWTPNADSSVWTFKLRDGVKFHDGTDFNSDDVIWSFKRIQDPETQNQLAAPMSIIKEVRKVDDHRVEFHLTSNFADFPLLLTDFRLKMVSADSEGNVHDTGNGTGPFRIVSKEIDGTTTYERFAEYWGGPAKLDKIEIITIPDAQARVQAMQAGQIDWLAGITPQEIPLFAGDGAFQVIPFSSGDWKGISFDSRVAPFDNPAVVKAIKMAVDREAMVKLVLGENGGSVSCDTPVAPTDQYRAEMTCPQDIEGAKKVLADAGFADGIDIDISTSDMVPNWVPIAEVLQQQVAPAGIRVNIAMEPADGYWSDVWMKKSAFLTWWSIRPADQVLNELLRSTAESNETQWNNPAFDALLDQARVAPTFDERKAFYTQAQQMIHDEGNLFIPFHINTIRVLAKGVDGLGTLNDINLKWEAISKADG